MEILLSGLASGLLGFYVGTYIIKGNVKMFCRVMFAIYAFALLTYLLLK